MMANCYKIIADEEKLKEFIEFLPDLNRNEKYYVSLFARKKYCNKLKSDKAQLKRFVADKKFLFHKIKRLEIPLDYYVIDDVIIPQEALCVYITVNPRDCHKASLKLLSEISNRIVNGNSIDNPNSLALDTIHKTMSKKIYFDVDIDFKENVDTDFYINKMKSIFSNPDEVLRFVRTRGGLHCLINLEKINKNETKTWYKNVMDIPNVDMTGDNLIPVVGCYQSEFVPHFIK